MLIRHDPAALRYELGGDHTYDFVEGVVHQKKASAIDGLVINDLGYFGYYEPNDCTTFHKALDDLEAYIDTDGPFDGIVSFSQGASLASALLLRYLNSGKSDPPFKCAIFFGGRSPFTETCIHAERCMLGSVIHIPTAHIWGLNDLDGSGGPRALKQLCDPRTTYLHEHDGGHEVPGARNKLDLIHSVNVIKRMLASL